MENYQHIKEWRKRTKFRLVAAFGGHCGICNYDKCLDALQFHHLDPEEKDFNISGSNVANWTKIMREARKCVCLCCRCHQEVHSGITSIPDNIERFDESYSQYKELRKMDNCPICGKEKFVASKSCSRICSSKRKSKIDWDKIDLKKMLHKEKLNYVEIGKILGVSDKTISKRARRLGLCSKVSSRKVSTSL